MALDPAYHCCDYCDQYRRDTMDIVNRAGQRIGYACPYCWLAHAASIARRKAEGMTSTGAAARG